jgi:glycosyltransferase involved in cell wall biosynthesis
VLAHLRAVKDPLLTARAARLLPSGSRVRVAHAGAALDAALERLARAEQEANPRYRWLGDLSRRRALGLLARSRLLSLTSCLEGGANVISEAVACSVPVVSSRIAGSIGILKRDYPGFFPVGDARALAALLERAERDRAFYRALRSRCAALRPLVRPERERRSWKRLLEELT